MIWCSRGASLGWNKSLELFFPQSHKLNALYYISFGHSRHIAPCFLLQHLVFRWAMMFADVLYLCNIFSFIFVVTVWDLPSWFCFHCHPRYFALSSIWHGRKAWRHVSKDSNFRVKELWCAWERFHGRFGWNTCRYHVLGQPPLCPFSKVHDVKINYFGSHNSKTYWSPLGLIIVGALHPIDSSSCLCCASFCIVNSWLLDVLYSSSCCLVSYVMDRFRMSHLDLWWLDTHAYGHWGMKQQSIKKLGLHQALPAGLWIYIGLLHGQALR